MAFMLNYLSLCIILVVPARGLTARLKDDPSQEDSFGVNKLGVCAAEVVGFGVINLEPLKRTDGYPRYYSVFRSSQSISSWTWNYTFNPCQPFNEPYNPHQKDDSTSRFGDVCSFINVCKFNQEGHRFYHYPYGVQNDDSPVFDGHLDKDTDIPSITITYRGTRSMEAHQTRIHLKCDKQIHDPDDGVFKILYDNSDTNGIDAELHHMCCCPGVCENGLPPKNQSSEVVSSPSETQQTKKTDNKKLLFIVGVNLLILILAGCVGIMCYKKKSHLQFYYKLPGVQSIPSSQYAMTLGSNDQVAESGTSVIEPLNNEKPSAFRDYEPDVTRVKRKLQVPVLENCLITNNHLELSQRLGGGIYSDTNAGNYTGLKVAVTRITLSIHENQLSQETLNWMKEEVWVLSRQRHRHIVSVLGICAENRLPYVVSEFVEGQSVKYFIENSSDSLTWPQRVKICVQAADGMAYLHSTKPPILHRDLRCANVFISEHGTVKVADFGLIKLIQPLREVCDQQECCCQGQYSACPPSIRWTAPEILGKPKSLETEPDSAVTTMSDVYSFGMVMWEIAVCEDPFGDTNSEQEVIAKVKQGARPDTGAQIEMLPMYRTLMHMCWNNNPENRPKFKQVATRLKELISQARSYQKNITNKKKLQSSNNSSTSDIKV